jgi:hypothetical protein
MQLEKQRAIEWLTSTNGEKAASVPASWEKLRIASTLLGTVLIPLVLVLITQTYTAAIKENEIAIRYVELALSILGEKPDESSKHIREWAVDVVNIYAKVPLPEEAVSELREGALSEMLSQQLLLSKVYDRLDKDGRKVMEELMIEEQLKDDPFGLGLRPMHDTPIRDLR